MSASPAKVVISGSFRRHLSAIQDAVEEFRNLGVEVLSPSDPRVVDEFGEFLYVASDRLRSIRAVQGRHLTAIRAARFVWLVDPDGYVGQSAAMEIGFALAVGTPVYSATPPTDLTLRQYVEVLPSPARAVEPLKPVHHAREGTSLLLSHGETAEELHRRVDDLERGLKGGWTGSRQEEIVTAFNKARSMLDFG